ncbi:MAG: hypothetical protein J5965_02855, partial [Aeriscardovia sp.]|nr:hypothetical protein [Aeriscardovia sp.]
MIASRRKNASKKLCIFDAQGVKRRLSESLNCYPICVYPAIASYWLLAAINESKLELRPIG